MSLFLRSLLWTILCPGTVSLLIPWFILSGFDSGQLHRAWPQWTGIALILAGSCVLLWCIYSFARYGSGTLSPADPARRLVVQGLYRYVRNPMYVGVMTVLLGEALLFGSVAMLGYAGVVFFAFNLFIRLHEEQYLKKQFGEEYERYCERVGRWLPGKPFF